MQPPVNERPKPRGPLWMAALFLLVIAGAAIAVWAPWAQEDGNVAFDPNLPDVSTTSDAPPSSDP